MVAEGTSALVTAFPAREGDAGARRLWELLGRLVGASGVWTGTQSELAATFTPPVSVKTIGRWTAALRADDVLQTRPAGKALEYGLLRWPQGAERATRATVLAFTPRATSDIAAPTSDTTADIESEGDVRGAAPTSDIESASRARFLDHHLHHPTSDTPTSDIHKVEDPDLGSDHSAGTSDIPTSDIRGGSGEGTGGDETPWAFLAREYRLSPTAAMVEAWVDLGPDGQRAFKVLAADNPPNRNYTPPTWFWKVHPDAQNQAQADRLRARAPRPARPTVPRGEAQPPTQNRPQQPKPEPRISVRTPWWHPFVMPAAIVCAALVLSRRGAR